MDINDAFRTTRRRRGRTTLTDLVWILIGRAIGGIGSDSESRKARQSSQPAR
jgi:hypothetical protein